MKNSNNDIIKYCLNHSTDLSAEQLSAYRMTQLFAYNPAMSSAPIQGRLLKMLSLMKRPDRILEIGTFTGFAALCLAEGLAKDGKVITIEMDEENYSLAQRNFEQSRFKDVIVPLLGDALKIIPELDENFDLVFIDAAKKHYIDFYELIIDKVRLGGFILVDNVLWFNKVLEEKKDPTTKAIHDFNEMVSKDTRVEHLLLPFEDGLQIIVRL